MKIERTKNASRNIVFGTILKVYDLAVPFIMRTVMIYLLGIEYVGLNSLFTSILQVLNLAELGVGSAMVFSMYEPIARDDRITICALMKIYHIYYRVIGIVVMVLGIFMYPFIPYLISGDIPDNLNVYVLYLLNLGATVFSYWLFAYKNSLIAAHQRIDVTSKITFFSNTIKYVIQITVLVVTKNYYLYLIVAMLSQVLTNVLTAIAATRMYPEYSDKVPLNRELMKSINQRIKDIFTAKLGATIVGSADTIVISAFLGLTVLAKYNNYYYIMNSIIALIMIILYSCLAGIGNSLVVDSAEKNYNDFKKMSFMISWIVGVCISCFLCLYQPFMEIWVGESNMLEFPFVILFCIYFMLYIINSLFCIYKDAGGIWHEDRFRPLLGGLLNLVLNLATVKFFGLFAILLSTIISYVVVTMPWLIYNIFKTLFKRAPWEFLKDLFKYILVYSASASICYFICSLIGDFGLAILIIRLIICLLISNAIFWVAFHKRHEYRYFVSLVKRMLHFD